MNERNYKIVTYQLNHSHLFWVEVIINFQKHQLLKTEKGDFLIYSHNSLIDYMVWFSVPRKFVNFNRTIQFSDKCSE